jgi:long-chain acyl-CoA synthetase
MSHGTTDLARRFDATAGRIGERFAISDGSGDWSFGKLRRTSEEISRLLENDGCRPGHRVALILPNSAAFVAAFFAVARIGGVVSPLNVRYGLQEFTYYLTDTQAAAVLVAPGFVDLVRGVLERLETPPSLFVVDDDGRCSRTVERRSDAQFRFRDEAAPLLQQYTSGSTGEPKRVVRGHAQLTFELETLSDSLDISETDKFLGVAPFSHVNGLVRSMMLSMFAGARLYARSGFDRRRVLTLLTEEKLTVFGGVPQMFVALAATPIQRPER